METHNPPFILKVILVFNMISVQIVFSHSRLSTVDWSKLFIEPSRGCGQTRLRFIREIYD